MVNQIYYFYKPVLYFVKGSEPHLQSTLQMPQCGHRLNSAAVRQKPLSMKPNNLLFTTGETQAGHCMSDGDPWVLINSGAEAETERAKKQNKD